MPICKNCGSRIEKFNKDRCPICGVENPFTGDGAKTVEITSNIEAGSSDFRPKKRKTMLILFIVLGFFGIPFFYIKENKKGFILFALNLITIGLLGFIFTFYGGLSIVASIFIGVGAMWLVNSFTGILLYRIPNLKDGNGEFII